MVPSSKAHSASWLAAVVLLGLGACAAGHAASAPPESAYLEGDAKLFDDGVDFIHSVLALEGRWQTDWEAELRARTNAASVIAVVEVHTLTTHTNPRGGLSHRLLVKPVTVLEGRLDAGGVQLASDEASRGFRTVDSNLKRLESGRYLLYAKEFRSETGVEALHWHLSPASEDVVAATTRLLAAGPSSHTVVVREHE